MSVRLQVLLTKEEADALKQTAEREGVTVSEWVRRSIRDAQRRQTTGKAQGKLNAIALAADFAFPTADVDVMLAEIERGYAE